MWRFSSALLKPIAVLLGIVSVTAVSAARADEPRLSISGYDPVAYFADGKPVPGKPEFEHLWHKARWRFASAEHRDLFVKEPNRYTPQYDGYCAMGVSGEGAAHKDSVDPHAWTIIDGKLYLAHSSYWLDVWRENAEQNIKRADAGWVAMVDLAEPVIVGAPCTTSPPTTVVALRGGGHWVVVGPQIARDESGNVVGKGDMRAQIEQIGKNVGACLKAGGAAVKDIVFTVNHVTEPGEFDKYGDLRVRYFGPPSPKSTTVRTPHLPDPDLLLQVEAFAAIQ